MKERFQLIDQLNDNKLSEKYCYGNELLSCAVSCYDPLHPSQAKINDERNDTNELCGRRNIWARKKFKYPKSEGTNKAQLLQHRSGVTDPENRQTREEEERNSNKKRATGRVDIFFFQFSTFPTCDFIFLFLFLLLHSSVALGKKFVHLRSYLFDVKSPIGFLKKFFRE